MGKQQRHRDELKKILQDRTQVEQYLVNHSSLPGRRINLELANAFADLNKETTWVQDWLAITADVNHPELILPFCSCICLGQLYVSMRENELLDLLKEMANDKRWRIREAIAFGLQRIAEKDYSLFQSIIDVWVRSAGELAQRAILVALAHPPVLNEQRASYCFEIASKVLQNVDSSTSEILIKGLNFTLSVFAVANPEHGFAFLKHWIGKNKVIDGIIQKNLEKKRLRKLNSAAIENLLLHYFS